MKIHMMKETAVFETDLEQLKEIYAKSWNLKGAVLASTKVIKNHRNLTEHRLMSLLYLGTTWQHIIPNSGLLKSRMWEVEITEQTTYTPGILCDEDKTITLDKAEEDSKTLFITNNLTTPEGSVDTLLAKTTLKMSDKEKFRLEVNFQ